MVFHVTNRISPLPIEQTNNTTVAIVSAFASAILAIILYKVFNENEDSLTRRLNRIKKLDRRDPNKPVRIWVDGCFDLMHFGTFFHPSLC